jgi:hypothetical protein
VYTGSDPDNRRWGWVQTVHSTGCYHWGNVQLHEALPQRHQVNVTVTRYRYNVVFDHQYCKVFAGKSSCTIVDQAVLTTDCVQWWYDSTAIVHRWNSGARVEIARGATTSERGANCLQ